MSELFGIDFAEEAIDAFGGELTPALFRQKTGTTPGLFGEAIPTFVDYEAEGLLTTWETSHRVKLGYSAKTMKVMLLANIPRPQDGDQVTIGGETFTVLDATFGAGEATYDMAGVPV